MPRWQALSAEYDCYVKESVTDLTEWYGGDDHSPAFTAYMQAKIRQQEAFMAVDCEGVCLGIIAFSKMHNRITFFVVSHRADFHVAARALFDHAFARLDASKPIYMNEIVSESEWMKMHGTLYNVLGFVYFEDAMENGVPVRTLVKMPF